MRTKDLRQNAAPPVYSLEATEDAVVAVSALLSLADWLRRMRSSQGELSCPVNLKDQSPPAPLNRPPARHPNNPIWRNLTADQRHFLLHVLSRLLARRLPAAPEAKEVRNDRN